MSDNIVAIKPKANSDVVEILEKLLIEAKVGELVSIAFIGHMPDYNVRFGNIRPEGMRQTLMIGAISFLEFKANQDMDDDS